RRLGLTRERVRQIEARALQRLAERRELASARAA
ncbi:MAG: sigma factor-like helix-turn-helix DNA-binding protein, partial [Thermoleophilia bacterium]